jgi:hypothetical protein
MYSSQHPFLKHPQSIKEATGFLDFVHCLVLQKREHSLFWEQDLILSSGGRVPTQMGPLERVSLYWWTPLSNTYITTEIRFCLGKI